MIKRFDGGKRLSRHTSLSLSLCLSLSLLSLSPRHTHRQRQKDRHIDRFLYLLSPCSNTLTLTHSYLNILTQDVLSLILSSLSLTLSSTLSWHTSSLNHSHFLSFDNQTYTRRYTQTRCSISHPLYLCTNRLIHTPCGYSQLTIHHKVFILFLAYNMLLCSVTYLGIPILYYTEYCFCLVWGSNLW